MRRVFLILHAAVLVLLAPNSMSIAAMNRALLVGVSDYGPDIEVYAPRLRGPGRDVALMLTILRDAGFDERHISVLTDRPSLLPQPAPERQGNPSRSQILSELEILASTAERGDRILLYLAGHGTQVAVDRNGAQADEPDGLDEVFLPIDARLEQVGPDRTLLNAIRDDEFGGFIDRMIAAGAHVWLVADTCHAGTLRRDTESGLVPRMVTLDPLATSIASDGEAVLAEPRRATGKFAAFYGARAGDLAFETEFEIDGEIVAHGLLTWALSQAIQAGARDYRDLSRQVQAHMSAASEGRSRPEFNGALGMAPLLGEDPFAGLRFGLTTDGEGLILSAGYLDGFRPGAQVKIGKPDGTVLGVANVTEIGIDAARLSLPAAGDRLVANLDALILSEGLDPNDHRLRWLRRRAPRLAAWPDDPRALRPALGIEIGPGLTSEADLTELVTEALQIDKDANGPRVARLDLNDGLLELSHRSMSVPLRLSPTYNGLDILRRSLRRLQSAERLVDVAKSLSSRGISAAISTEITVQPSTAAACLGVSEPRMRAQGTLVVHHCDDVAITLKNNSRRPLSVSPLYVAPDGAIYYLSGYPGGLRGGLRLLPGDTDTVRYREDTQPRDGVVAATGRTTLVFLAVEMASEDQPPPDFRYLETSPEGLTLRASKPAERGTGVAAAGAVLIELETRPPKTEEGLP